MIPLDDGDPKNNMYGCPPCPKCGGKYMAPFKNPSFATRISVECDDCGHKEIGRSVDQSNLLDEEATSLDDTGPSMRGTK